MEIADQLRSDCCRDNWSRSYHPAGEAVYWLEIRFVEGGRYVLVRRSPDGSVDDITPSPFNVRTRVHEYGGGAYTVLGETVYFTNFADQRLYRQAIGLNRRQSPLRLLFVMQIFL